MPTKIIHYLDSTFLALRGRSRLPEDLSLELEPDEINRAVVLKFSEPVHSLPLLPGEAEQLADSLTQLAQEVEGIHDDEDEDEEPTAPGLPPKG